MEKTFTWKRVRWGRVAMCLAIMFCIGYTVVDLAKNTVSAVPVMIEKADSRFVQNVLEKHEQVEVSIYYGETVWDVQQRLLAKGHPYNMNDILYVLTEINGGYSDWWNVKAGDTFYLLKPRS